VRFVDAGIARDDVLDAALCGPLVDWRRFTAAREMLTSLLRAGGFIAGGFARAAVIIAQRRWPVPLSALQSQFGDIDVFFDREVTFAELKSMVKKCNIDDEPRVPTAGDLQQPHWCDQTIAYAGYSEVRSTGTGCYYVSFGDERIENVHIGWPGAHGGHAIHHQRASGETVRINVITFKHGSPTSVINDFDVTPCQVAICNDGSALVRSDFARIERDGLVGVNWEILRTRPFSELRIVKTVDRLAKYAHRVALTVGGSRIPHGELAKIIRIANDVDVKRLQHMSWESQRKLAAATTAEDCMTFAMMVWPETYLVSKMFMRLCGR
jgi:hypothetical protein